jgi:hypothetical protein
MLKRDREAISKGKLKERKYEKEKTPNSSIRKAKTKAMKGQMGMFLEGGAKKPSIREKRKKTPVIHRKYG